MRSGCNDAYPYPAQARAAHWLGQDLTHSRKRQAGSKLEIQVPTQLSYITSQQTVGSGPRIIDAAGSMVLRMENGEYGGGGGLPCFLIGQIGSLENFA